MAVAQSLRAPDAAAQRGIRPLEDVRDISRIAYGFMASKALFAALSLGIFDALAQSSLSLDALAERVGIGRERLKTLVAVLVSVGLIASDKRHLSNAPAARRYLVRGAPAYFGDYYRFQIDRIIYPQLMHLEDGLRGKLDASAPEFAALDRQQAEDFSRGQHSGSLGPAVMLARTIDLSGRKHLLDIGGGSGAFSITLCRQYPELVATIVDFPRMCAVGRGFASEAGIGGRVGFVEGEALAVCWPADQDVVLMSYLLSAVAGDALAPLVGRAYAALKPGGTLIIHDFMLEDGAAGPALAAGWFLSYLAWSVENVSFSARQLGEIVRREGFTDIEDRPLIAEITSLVLARKPAT